MRPDQAIKKVVLCQYCNEEMESMNMKSFSSKWSIGLIAGGAFCTFLFVGPLLGLPMLLAGIYMTTAEDTINYCPACGNYYKTLNPKN